MMEGEFVVSEEPKEKKVILVKKQSKQHRRCLNCGKIIDDKRSNAKYCCHACWLAQSKYASNPIGGPTSFIYDNFLNS